MSKTVITKTIERNVVDAPVTKPKSKKFAFDSEEEIRKWIKDQDKIKNYDKIASELKAYKDKEKEKEKEKKTKDKKEEKKDTKTTLSSIIVSIFLFATIVVIISLFISFENKTIQKEKPDPLSLQELNKHRRYE